MQVPSELIERPTEVPQLERDFANGTPPVVQIANER